MPSRMSLQERKTRRLLRDRREDSVNTEKNRNNIYKARKAGIYQKLEEARTDSPLTSGRGNVCDNTLISAQ